MITITNLQSGAAATIDEDLTIATNDEALREELQDEVDFAQTQGGYIKPVLLVLYDELKLNLNFKVDIPAETLKELQAGNDDEGTIF